MASCAERGLPVTSPFGDALSEKLEPDVKMAAVVHKYRMKDKGRGRGTTAHCIHLNRHILNCGSAGGLCELIEVHAEEFNHINVATAWRKLLQPRSRRNGVPRVEERALQSLEAEVLLRMDAFEAQQVANILHIMAKTRYRPLDAERQMKAWYPVEMCTRVVRQLLTIQTGNRACHGRGDTWAGRPASKRLPAKHSYISRSSGSE